MKYIILQASFDGPSYDDDGLDGSLNFGLASPKLFETLEEAKKEQQEIAKDTLADLSDCYGITDEDCDTSIEGDIDDYSDTNGDIEVNFWDHGYLINSTIIRIQGVEF